MRPSSTSVIVPSTPGINAAMPQGAAVCKTVEVYPTDTDRTGSTPSLSRGARWSGSPSFWGIEVSESQRGTIRRRYIPGGNNLDQDAARLLGSHCASGDEGCPRGARRKREVTDAFTRGGSGNLF
jgi:hypothetical protein